MPIFFHFEYQSYIVLLTLVNDYYTDRESNYNECQFQLLWMVFYEWYFTNGMKKMHSNIFSSRISHESTTIILNPCHLSFHLSMKRCKTRKWSAMNRMIPLGIRFRYVARNCFRTNRVDTECIILWKISWMEKIYFE